MKDLSFIQYDEEFLSFLKERRKNFGEKSVVREIEKLMAKNNIVIDLFFLESYLSQYKCPDLNDDLLKLFDKAVYVNEKIGILQYLMANDYDKAYLKQIINSELLRLTEMNSEYSETDLECYEYDLKELLRQLNLRKKQTNQGTVL